jgi:ABC-type glycerol-3-phosphate transport system permease component
MTFRIRYGHVAQVALTYAVLLLGAAIVILPIYLAVVDSLLPKQDAISYPPKLFAPDPQLVNYKKAMEVVPLRRYMFNSFTQSSIITIGQLITATLSAYAFAFMRFPLRNFLFILFLSTLMVPWEASIIPNFQTVQMMGDPPTDLAVAIAVLVAVFVGAAVAAVLAGVFGDGRTARWRIPSLPVALLVGALVGVLAGVVALRAAVDGKILSLDSYQALTIPFLATAFGTFLMRQHFMTIPLELRDAAAIDGYGHLRFLWHVVLPLSKPALGTLAVFAFLQSWNQYLWPLLVTNSDTYRTVQIGLAGLASQEIDSINVVMAGTVIALLPMLIVIVLFQRQLVRGLMQGALKG